MIVRPAPCASSRGVQRVYVASPAPAPCPYVCNLLGAAGEGVAPGTVPPACAALPGIADRLSAHRPEKI